LKNFKVNIKNFAHFLEKIFDGQKISWYNIIKEKEERRI